MRTWKVILATLVIFVAGMVTGALVMRSAFTPAPREAAPPPPWIFQGPDFVQKRFLDRMTKELELTPDQTQKLGVILREGRERARSWWEIVGPEFQTELKETKAKMTAVLTPAQQEKFEKLLRERHHTPGGPLPGDRRGRERRSGAGPGSNAPSARPVP